MKAILRMHEHLHCIVDMHMFIHTCTELLTLKQAYMLIHLHIHTHTRGEMYNTRGLSNCISLCCHCSNYLKTLPGSLSKHKGVPFYSYAFNAESSLCPAASFPGSGIYSLPLANVSNRDSSQLNCCSQSLAHAAMKRIVLKLWDLASA